MSLPRPSRPRIASSALLLAVAAAAGPASAPAGAASPAAPGGATPSGFDALFTGSSMRLDLSHTGSSAGESFTLDAVSEEGEWAGSRSRLIDDTNFGAYQFLMYDASTNRPIFSQGFSSLFGEWRTTDEAKSAPRTMHETILAPMPRAKVWVRVAGRGPGNALRDLFAAAIDPASYVVARHPCPPPAGLFDIAVTGAIAERLDLLIVAEGYAEKEQEKFRRDAARFSSLMLAFPPYSENRGRINVRGLWSASADSGTDEPRKGIFRRTATGTTFDTFDVERYLTDPDDRALHDLVACAPYDRLIVLVNSSRYGGAGIHDQWAVVSTDNEYSDYVAIHEFGHSLAGLGDEYFTSAVAYNDAYPKGVEPWEPNLTALVPDGKPKWAAMLTPGAPVPTPPDPNRYGSAVGAFEGAGYSAKGLYRPSLDCMMFSKGYAPFDPVCRRAIEEIIERYSSPAGR